MKIDLRLFSIVLQVKRGAEFGIAGQYAASLVYGLGIGQAIGRAIGGFAVDHVPINKIVMISCVSILCGVTIDVGIYFPSYTGKA